MWDSTRQRQTLLAILAATYKIAELEWDLDLALLEEDGKWLVGSDGTKIKATVYHHPFGYGDDGYETPAHRSTYIEWRVKDLTKERQMIRAYCYG